MHEGTGGPTRGGVTTAGPGIIPFMIVDVKVEAEPGPVFVDGSVEIRDGEHHRDEPLDS